MLRFIFRVYDFVLNKLMEPIERVVGRVYLIGKGVSFGNGVRIYGMPIVTVCKGSDIILGSNAVLRSKSKGNAIGVNHEIVFRTCTQAAKIIIGDNFGMSGGAICAVNKIEIGNNVLVGANVVIADNDFHGLKVSSRRVSTKNLPSKPIYIEDGVWLGADVYVCKGVRIGENSVIGAKSVVTRDIPKNSVAAGIPAIVINEIDNT